MGKSKKILFTAALTLSAALILAGCGIRFGKPASSKETQAETPAETTAGSGDSVSNITQKETDPEGVPVTLSGDMQYEANIFLSNFAEQYGFTSYRVSDHDVQLLMDFAHRYAKINASGNISYDAQYEVITLDYANTVLDRFFGDSVSAGELSSFPAPSYSYDPGYRGPYYQNSRIYYEAADGATTTEFVVVDSVHSFPDGTMDMLFTRYEVLDFFDSIGGLAVTDQYYSMTPQQAASSTDIQKIGEGWATVIPKSYNGRDTYELVTYQEN